MTATAKSLNIESRNSKEFEKNLILPLDLIYQTRDGFPSFMIKSSTYTKSEKVGLHSKICHNQLRMISNLWHLVPAGIAQLVSDGKRILENIRIPGALCSQARIQPTPYFPYPSTIAPIRNFSSLYKIRNVFFARP